jgi:hypothetical protein
MLAGLAGSSARYITVCEAEKFLRKGVVHFVNVCGLGFNSYFVMIKTFRQTVRCPKRS